MVVTLLFLAFGFGGTVLLFVFLPQGRWYAAGAAVVTYSYWTGYWAFAGSRIERSYNPLAPEVRGTLPHLLRRHSIFAAAVFALVWASYSGAVAAQPNLHDFANSGPALLLVLMVSMVAESSWFNAILARTRTR